MDVNTITAYLLTVVTLVVFSIYLYFKQTFTYWRKRGITCIEPTIPFGNLLNVYTKKCTLAQAFGDAYLELKKLGVKHGGMYVLNTPVYIPVDENIIKHIMVTDGNNFIDHGFYINAEDDPLSAHLFNLEGEKWRNVRKKTTEAFSSAKIKKMFTIMVETAKIFQTRLKQCTEKCQEDVDIKKESLMFTIDTGSLSLFGLESETLKGKNEQILTEMYHLTIGQWNIFKNSMVFLLPRNILKMMRFRLFPQDSTEYVRNMCVGLKDYRKNNNIRRGDITDILCRLTERDDDIKSCNGLKQEPLTENEFIAQMWLFLGASSESSASTIAFALYELTKKPEYQNKVREEINRVLEMHDDEITLEAVQEMQYLDCIVQETLRLYPLFPILSRVCKRDYKVPGTDFVMEKNTFVMVTNFGIHRDPEYYPDPLTFDPERFTRENRAKRPFTAFMPFGEGPRMCPGKKPGLLQTKVGLITVFKNFEVSLSDKTKKGFEFVEWEMLLRKKGDIFFNLRKIN